MQIRPGDAEYNVNEKILLPKDKFLPQGRSSSLSDNNLITSDNPLAVAPVHLITPVRNSDSEEDSNSDYDATNNEWTED
jgi:hypothetical protein